MERNINEILQLNPNIPEEYEVIRTEYIPKDIHTVKIGGKAYTNYGGYWFFWEKTYAKSPTRAENGAMATINEISTFLTGHLFIDFSVISIDDYRSIMRSHYEQNEFVVECYDPIYNDIITLKMYFATEERKKLYMLNRSRFDGEKWEEFLLLAGVKEYQLEMIGTNNDLDTVTVTYNFNAPSDVGNYATVIGGQEVAKGMDFICGAGATYNVVDETFNGRYRFVGWNSNKDGSGQPYADGYVYTINQSVVLYAVWGRAENLTLTYSYGISDPMTVDGKPVYTKTVKYNQSIGELPTFDQSPFVTESSGGVTTKYYPYTNGAWYKTSTKAPNSKPLTGNEDFWSTTDSQIYLLYDAIKYAVEYYVDGILHSTASVEYNTALPLLEIYKTGFKLSGWYLDAEYKKPAPTIMPPYPIKLYAKWN